MSLNSRSYHLQNDPHKLWRVHWVEGNPITCYARSSLIFLMRAWWADHHFEISFTYLISSSEIMGFPIYQSATEKLRTLPFNMIPRLDGLPLSLSHSGMSFKYHCALWHLSSGTRVLHETPSKHLPSSCLNVFTFCGYSTFMYQCDNHTRGNVSLADASFKFAARKQLGSPETNRL